MEFNDFSNHLQYVERNGVTLNIEEKMNLGMAVHTLKADLHLTKVYMLAKITGKKKFSIMFS